VLGRKYWYDARIKGSISAPLRILATEAQQWNKEQEIVIYCACRECDASEKAYKLLAELGFKNLWAYEGGIREWWKLGYPCEGPCVMQYLREEGDSRKIKWDLD
jgi:rhodanese-related sulfurtransferase